ncbi:OmpA family protein [Virgibacillus necropolis]|uniref:OmpA family protein n=1 Tax=Virgibacillus necropolis TaxID=163877 RepID=UPI00384AF906
MIKNYIKLVIITCFICLLFGCTDEKMEKKKGEDAPEETEQSVSADSGNGKVSLNNVASESQKEKSTNYKQNIGDMKAWIGGEVIVKKDKIIVNGKSNIYPGSVISSHGISTLTIANFNENAEIQEDGSFHFEFPGYEGNASVTFGLSPLGTGEEHYGEGYKNATGPQVYRTPSMDWWDVRASIKLDEDKEKPYTIQIETPVWQDRPDDYGDTEVRIDNVEITSDHEYLYIHGESNLVEGTLIRLLRKDKNGDNIPFTGDGTTINPDGTFDMKEHYLTLREGQYILLKVDSPNYWDNVVEVYGEDLKHIEGDLVKRDEEGKKYVKYEVPIDVPKLSPPEEVSLTVKEEEIKLKMEATLLFDFDKSKLKSDAKKLLDGLLDDLQELESGTVVHINGHTDNQGETKYNLKLSEERAKAVLDYLKKNGDIDELKIRSKGYGETKPIASNGDSSGREENRRVEIVINPEKES